MNMYLVAEQRRRRPHVRGAVQVNGGLVDGDLGQRLDPLGRPSAHRRRGGHHGQRRRQEDMRHPHASASAATRAH